LEILEMKYLGLCLIAFAGVSYGECIPGNFEVQLGQFANDGSSYQIPLTVTNNNDQACAAEIEVQLSTAEGTPLSTQSGLLASSGNISPGTSISDDWGSRFADVAGGAGASATVTGVRTCLDISPPGPGCVTE
jgi:hypothetical protein